MPYLGHLPGHRPLLRRNQRLRATPTGRTALPSPPSLIERHLTDKTRAVVINSPCNPSGEVIPPEEFQRIYRLTSKRGIWLITDECYSHLVYDGLPFSVASTPGARSTVIVAGSLSKTYAMTGWRIGYVLAPPLVVSAVAKLQSQSTSNPNSIAQKAAVEALQRAAGLA